MGLMMSLNEQLIHSMKKMRLTNSSVSDTAFGYDGVHLIPDETTPSSPFRKYTVGASTVNQQAGEVQLKYDQRALLCDQYFYPSHRGQEYNSVGDSLKGDTPILSGMSILSFWMQLIS